MRIIPAFLSLFFIAALGAMAVQVAYRSPYQIVFGVPSDELHAVDRKSPRNDSKKEANIPYEDWYSATVRKREGAWGPKARHYPVLDASIARTPDWKRQRVLAVAASLIGLPYQHHHIPDWQPPRHWPWKPVAYGKNSKGLDCSNFTSWVYNFGLGIHMSSNVDRQSENRELSELGGKSTIRVKLIRDENGFDDLVRKLKTGDLLYIRRKGSDKISHVIMWVGEFGRSPDKTPLVIDCTGPGYRDCNANFIPIGVQLRPFEQNSWYYRSFSHAHRIIDEPINLRANSR